jgi:flagellar biogenesis protein FliO
MVVVPTQEDVVIEFVDTWPETAGKLITAASLVLLVLWGVRRRRRRRVDEMVS